MQNKAQHDLDRKAAKMSALSANNLNNWIVDKCEYLTGKDLVLNQALLKKLDLIILR